jgi:hypothetical protein
MSRRLVMHDAARADVDEIAAGLPTDAGIRFYDAVQTTCESSPNTRTSVPDGPRPIPR